MKTEPHGAVHHQSPTGLCIFWLEVLELAHAGDDDGVGARLAQLQMRREDLDEIFGPGSGSRLWNEYTRAFASFAGAGAREIAHKIRERRYDDVEILPQPAHVEIASASLGEQGQGGQGLSGSMASPERATGSGFDSLRTNSTVYSVRLKRTDETDGIRIDTFVYLDGAWRTALKVGRR